MTNEDFQRIVLEELKGLKEGQRRLEERQRNLEEGQRNLVDAQRSLEEGQRSLEDGQRSLESKMLSLDSRMTNLEIGQRQIIEKLDAVWEQTAILTEFREEANQKLDTLLEENVAIKEVLGTHEIDIRRIKKII